MSPYKPPRRHVRLVFACLVSLMSLLFMRLGYWQLDRADQSQAVAEMVRLRAELPPMQLGSAVWDADELIYRRVLMKGEFEPRDRIFIDGRKQDGVLGYHLIVPFHLEGSDVRVLVNRGWVAEVDTDPKPLPKQIEGIVASPRVPPLRIGAGAGPGAAPWPFVDIQRFARATGYPVRPYLVVEDPRLAEEVLAGGLETAEKWGMHIGYAIQWFVFALLAAVLFFVVIRAPRKEVEREGA